MSRYLTPGRIERMLVAARSGLNRRDVAKWGGVADATLANWIRRGETTDDEPYRSFARDYREAEAEANDFAMRIVRNAMENEGPDSLKAAMWFLDRRGYKPDQRIELDARVQQQAPLLDARRLDPDQAKQLAQLLALASGEDDALGDFAGLEAYERRRDALDAGDPALLLPGDVAWIQANPAEAENQGWTMDNGRPVPVGGEE